MNEMRFLIILLFLAVFLQIQRIESKNDDEKKDASARKNKLPMIAHTFVINLDNRQDRLENMKKQLDALQIPFTRFPAVNFHNGESPKLVKEALKGLHPHTRFHYEQAEKFTKDKQNPWFNWGSVGCWQSHLQVFLQIARGDYKSQKGPFLILEDDVNITSRIYDILSEDYLYHYLPQDWEMIYLDHMDLQCHSPNPAIWTAPLIGSPREKLYCLISFAYLNSAYIIRNVAVAEKLIKAANTPAIQAADGYINKLFHSLTVRAYAIIYRPVFQIKNQQFGSNILDNRIFKRDFLQTGGNYHNDERQLEKQLRDAQRKEALQEFASFFTGETVEISSETIQSFFQD